MGNESFARWGHGARRSAPGVHPVAMSRPVFADPKTGFVFQRIFGSEDHKPALLGFLNDLLELDGTHRIQSVSLLPPEQRPKVSELKYSIVDVKCVECTARRMTYVVEMQVLNVEAFEKRVNIAAGMAIQNERGTLSLR
jgi:hypothetical protein